MKQGSGRLWLADGVIRCEQPQGEWAMPCRDLRLFGEMTNDGGPFVDDYWFCFASGPSGWNEASFYAEGRDEFLSAISAELGSAIGLELQGSTDYASRVLWPPALEGVPMFDFTPRWSSFGLIRLVQRALGGPASNTQTLTREVTTYLRGVHTDPSG